MYLFKVPELISTQQNLDIITLSCLFIYVLFINAWKFIEILHVINRDF